MGIEVKLIIFAIVLVLVLGLILPYALKRFRIKRAGKQGELITAQLLRRYIKQQGGILYKNISIPLYDAATEIDLLVITAKGILCIENKHVSGTIVGHVKERKWVQKKQQGEKKTFYNPILQNEGHIKCLKHHLAKANMNTPIDSYIVFSHPKVKLMMNYPNVGTLASLKAYLNQYQQGRYHRINIKEVKAFIEKIKC